MLPSSRGRLGATLGADRRLPNFAPPGKAVAYDNRLLPINSGLLWGVMACYFGLLGFPGSCKRWGLVA